MTHPLRPTLVYLGGMRSVRSFGRVASAVCVSSIIDAYEKGDDVVATGIDGRTVVLGVDRFPFRDPAPIRRTLVEELRRSAGKGFEESAS